MPKSTASTKDKLLARKEELKAEPNVARAQPLVEPARESDSSSALEEPGRAQFEAAKLETPDLMASLTNVQAALAERTQERDTLKTKLDRVTFLMDALKRSYGLSPAAVILETPVEPPGGSVIERYNSITDDMEKAKFYAAHKEELLRHINKGVPDRNSLPDTYRW